MPGTWVVNGLLEGKSIDRDTNRINHQKYGQIHIGILCFHKNLLRTEYESRIYHPCASVYSPLQMVQPNRTSTVDVWIKLLTHWQIPGFLARDRPLSSFLPQRGYQLFVGNPI